MNNFSSLNYTNEELLNIIENKLKYEHRFGYISNSYFRYIIEREQSNIPRLLIYGDFDKIGQANKKYGFKLTTLFIKRTSKKTIDFLKNTLNLDVSCVSLGGDEFLFIVNNPDQDIVPEELINEIQKNVFTKSILSLSLGTSQYSPNKGICSTISQALADARIMSEKNKLEKNKIQINEKLKYGKYRKKRLLLGNIEKTMSTFFSAISANSITSEQKSLIREKILHALKNGFSEVYSLNSQEETSVENTNTQNLPQLSLNWKENHEELLQAFQLLSTNPNTKGLRKAQLPCTIKSLNGKQFYYLFMDITHLKASNLLYGHGKTNITIESLIDDIKSTLHEYNIELSDTTNIENSKNLNVYINIVGCKLLFLLSADNPNINSDVIHAVVNKIKNQNFKSILGVSCSYFDNPHQLSFSKKFDRDISKLTSLCNVNKESYKRTKDVRPQDSQLWLQKLIEQLEKDFTNLGFDKSEFDSVFIPSILSALDKIHISNIASNNFLATLTNPTTVSADEKNKFRSSLKCTVPSLIKGIVTFHDKIRKNCDMPNERK